MYALHDTKYKIVEKMYRKEEIKLFTDKTNEWLSSLNAHNSSFDVNDIESLRSILRFHEHRYYVLDNPLISDSEYDILFNQLKKIEAEHPEYITADSPTQRVGSSLNDGFNTVQHIVPMLSLDNSFSGEDLIDWNRKATELAETTSLKYCVEPKFDGASISLIYENDVLIKAVTRGDGIEGDDITTNIKQIRSIPLRASFSNYGIQMIEIRGEVMMSKKSFDAYNQSLVAQGLSPLANPRNAASGSLRMKDPAEVAKRNLDAILYHISYVVNRESSIVRNTEEGGDRREEIGEYNNTNVNRQSSIVSDTADGKIHDSRLRTQDSISSHSASLQMLWDLGFRSPVKEMKVVDSIEGVIDYINEFETKRDTLPYEIDGMVVKVDDLTVQDHIGMTSHHPRWAIAYKFKARQATTQLLSVEFQVGRTGAVTPVAKLKSVPLGGVTVSSISIHNEDYIKEKQLMIGDAVLIERAGDVIPQIVKSFPELRTGEETEIKFPTHCPVCNSVLFKEDGEAVWRCINIECEAQVVEKIIHFVSKDAMDIKSLGEANIRSFYEAGLLKDIPGIYTLNYDSISTMEGFGKKSVDNLIKAIEASKQQPLHRLIYALGIRFVGETTAKTLATAIDAIFDLADKTEEDLKQLDDVGIKVASSIFSFFHNHDNLHILHLLEGFGLQMKNDKKGSISEGSFTGKSFLFTGTLSRMKRSEAEALVEQNGGTIVGNVSNKLNFLVVGADAGSKLEKAKKLSSIQILTEDEFLASINGGEHRRES